MKFIKPLFSILLITILSACSTATAKDDVKKDEPTIVKVGVVGDSTNFIWDIVNENLKDENIIVELQSFSDGTYTNIAQSEGELDLTSFQHHAFLNQEINDKGYDFTAIADTYVAPLNIFSEKVESVSEIKEGDTILIPNNVTNAGRALIVLDRAGLITVDPEKGNLPTSNDILENPLKLKIEEADPATILQLLPDVAAGITNAGIVQDNGKDPIEDAIFNLEIDPDDEAFAPYINVIVARTEDKDNEIYAKVVEAYLQDNVKEAITKEYGNVFIPVW
ncbi:MetQ/NlpA family ABC transporter substrate-binding protein [Enterococcus sp. DIV1314a]|uniref:MetQ/NlpA family ABC transporter substrate-binding protein n=1 Tax=Enterococcus sp. DIV1314a TaxID=2774660 RepID=UPI003F27ED18